MGSGKKDGGLGLAPGSKGFKSYPEHLLERKLIAKNTVNVYYNEYLIDDPPLLYIVLDTDEEELGKGVNYLPLNFGNKDLATTLWTASFQGFGLSNKSLDLKFSNTSRSHFYVEYLLGLTVYASSDSQRALNISNTIFKTL